MVVVSISSHYFRVLRLLEVWKLYSLTTLCESAQCILVGAMMLILECSKRFS